MDEREPNAILDANVGRLLKASATKPSAKFDAELVRVVLAEVRAEQARSRTRRFPRNRWIAGVGVAAAAAAIVLAALAIRYRGGPGVRTVAAKVGEITPSYGLVLLKDGQPARPVAGLEGIRPGEWVTTRSGSEARIVLADKSLLFVPPRTVLQVDEKPHGQTVFLREGFLRIEAAKQAAGRALTIETPGSHVRVLGTKLDVHLVQKADGRRQTRVSVTAGRVELESAGRTVALLPNMEGIADEGRPPVARSLTAEVNEMARLIEKNKRLAEEAHVAAGMPAIIEFSDYASVAVWTLLSIENKNAAALSRYALRPSPRVSGIEAFTPEGAAIPVVTKDGSRYLDLSFAPVPAGGRTQVIVKLVGADGLFVDKGSGEFEFDAPANAAAGLSLFQFRLPASASIEETSPKPIETREELSRRVFTVAASSQIPRFFD